MTALASSLPSAVIFFPSSAKMIPMEDALSFPETTLCHCHFPVL